MKKILKIFTISLIVLLLLNGMVWGSGWLWSRFRPIEIKFPAQAEMCPESGVVPGMAVTARFSVKLPECARIRRAALECGKNSVSSGEVEILCRKWKWDKREYEFIAQLFAPASGTVSAGKIGVTVALGKGEKEFSVTVPGFDVALAPDAAPGGKLLLTDKVALPRPPLSRHWLWLLLLLPCAMLIWHLLRRRKKAQEQSAATPWEVALSALTRLRLAANAEEILPESGFVRLTDIVRNYLEARFGLPASRRTTPEFLHELSRSTILPEERKPFLREFLNAADRIKFAREQSDNAALGNAVGKAEDLVRGTTPEQGGKQDV